MNRWITRLLAAVLTLGLGLAGAPVLVHGQAAAQAAAADRWEKDIAAFEAQDRRSPPPAGEIVFVGSSTIVRWDLAKYFPELKTINRGFGGSQLSDAVRYADRIVMPYKPRIVVVYAGDNDIMAGVTSEEVAVHFEKFVAKVHKALPETRIAFIGLKPSISRFSMVERMRRSNEMIRAFCGHDDRLAFVDMDGIMLGWDEKPRPELFVADGLHLSPAGYTLWTTVLRPLLSTSAAQTSTRR